MRADTLDTLQVKLPACPGIQQKETYFTSAVLLPLVVQDGECCLLFQKRASHIRQGGEICFPGGQYDPELDQDYQATAVRETVEELGIRPEQITVLGGLDVVVSPLSVLIEPFVGILHIADLDELAIDRNEVEEVFLLPVAYFEENPPEEYRARVEVRFSHVDENGREQILLPVKELGLPDRYLTPCGRNNHRVLVYRLEPELIWGITAGIIDDFIRVLHGGHGGEL